MHFTHGWTVLVSMLSGSTATAFLAHLVQTFPTPDNKYGQWLLGGLQFLVGQRERAANTVSGNATVTLTGAKQ